MVEELNCSNYEDRAILYAAGELNQEDSAAVEAHAQKCANCAAILSREIGFRKTLAVRVQPADTLDRSDLLLARCRSELFETLDDAAAQPKRSWTSLAPWRWLGAFARQLCFVQVGVQPPCCWSEPLLVPRLANCTVRSLCQLEIR